MKKENLPIIIAIALPIFFIVLVSMIIFVPNLFIKPQYDFIYSYIDYYGYRKNVPEVDVKYKVIDNKITISNPEYVFRNGKVYQKVPKNLTTVNSSSDIYGGYQKVDILTYTGEIVEVEISEDLLPEIYLYDFESETSKMISFSEAQKINLDPGPSSPDGYKISYKNYYGGIFDIFGSNNDKRGWYVEKGDAEKKIDGLAVSTDYYYSNNNFEFIGWVK